MRAPLQTPNQLRVLFALLAVSAALKLWAALWFATATLLVPSDRFLHAALAAFFAVGFVWLARCLKPAVKPLFG